MENSDRKNRSKSDASLSGSPRRSSTPDDTTELNVTGEDGLFPGVLNNFISKQVAGNTL